MKLKNLFKKSTVLTSKNNEVTPLDKNQLAQVAGGLDATPADSTGKGLSLAGGAIPGANILSR